jgi:hypothetical protein
LLGDLFGEWLVAGAQRSERGQLLFYLAMAIFALLLDVILLLQNGSSRLALWPEGSFYGLMFSTLVAIPGVPVGAAYFIRHKIDRPLSAACVLTSCGALVVSFWFLSR